MKNKPTKIIIACAAVVLLLIAAAFLCTRYVRNSIMDGPGMVNEAVDPGDIITGGDDDKSDVENERTPVGEDARSVEEEAITLPVNGARPGLLSDKVTLNKPNVVPDTTPYEVAPDLSNIYNRESFYFDEKETDFLVNNKFFVNKPYGRYEFFEIYESNRYGYVPNFVTVDSLMHTYHLYFSCLLKSVEKDQLAAKVTDMSRTLFTESMNQYKALKGTEWESAAKRNAEYFGIGLGLADQIVIEESGEDKEIADVILTEIKKIEAADGIKPCAITADDEDYSQYKPRGYYEGDEQLEKYFRTMIWYGRINFNTESEDLVKSSLLINKALHDTCSRVWADIYDVTAFFAGTSDDLGYYEYYPLIQKIYGDNVTLEEMAGDADRFERFCREVKTLKLPEINSQPIDMGEDNIIQGFRLMGQRFTVDSAIMQKLIYSAVDENSAGQLRMLPDVLDVAAALGSDTAYNILREQGDTEFKNYSENMDELRSRFAEDAAQNKLSASLYGSWLNTLRPLLNKKGEGYPSFMQNDAWATKDVETFAGSYTELKHDTVLYAKQVMAEMGGGEIPELDDRGYVQPEPEVYARFVYLSRATKEGLLERKLIDDKDAENLERLAELAEKLQVISEKELVEEVLTDEEYDFIREYGGNLEHFWRDATVAMTGDEEANTEKYQAALVVDVATDPNGAVLEMATGRACNIYVVVNVDGKLKIASGSVYSFYEFPWPMDDRLTDTKWRRMMGFEPAEDGFFGDTEDMIDIPWWTRKYSYVYEY